MNAPAVWFTLHKQALDDEPNVLQYTGVIEVGKKDGLRHYHWLIQARTSAEGRKFTAFCNDILMAGEIQTKYQIKKTTSQTPANIESILIYMAKDLKVTSPPARAPQPPWGYVLGVPCTVVELEPASHPC